MATKLVKSGKDITLIIPTLLAQKLGFKPGTYVRFLAVDQELRVRLATSSVHNELQSYEDYMEAEIKREHPEKW